MGSAMETTGSAERWAKRGKIIIPILLVGAVGVWWARSAKRVSEPEPTGPESAASARASMANGSSSPSGSASAEDGGVQHFDTTEDPRFIAGVALRPMDRDIFAALADEHLERTRMIDVFPDRPYRVRFIGSLVEHHFAAVLIEMHRDGKVDERWTMKGNDVTRTVPEDPAAGGTPVRYSLAHGRWQLH